MKVHARTRMVASYFEEKNFINPKKILMRNSKLKS